MNNLKLPVQLKMTLKRCSSHMLEFLVYMTTHTTPSIILDRIKIIHDDNTRIWVCDEREESS